MKNDSAVNLPTRGGKNETFNGTDFGCPDAVNLEDHVGCFHLRFLS